MLAFVLLALLYDFLCSTKKAKCPKPFDSLSGRPDLKAGRIPLSWSQRSLRWLIDGRYVKLTALGFVVYILLVNLMLHDFWNDHAGVSSDREMQNFVKNLGILAGLLVLAGHAPARALSFKGWWRSDRAQAAG